MAWSWWNGFEKMMCGKWISEQFEINGNYIRIFLNIEQTEAEVKIKFDFDSDSFENEAFYVEYSYDSLYFFHNDREHRAEYILTMENDDLIKCKFSVINCWGYKGKFEKDIAFTRLETLSDEEKKKYAASNKVKPKDIKKIDLLKEYAEYGDIKSDVKFEFKFDERENLLDIIQKYNLDELVKGKNDVETSITLMNWLCGLYKHGNPPKGLPEKRTPQALMEAADKFESRTNCRGLSLILSQLIRAYNIKAFHITCSPYENPFDDCHVVVCVYCESLGKYIMLDPSSNLYLKNENGEIIGVEELRDILIKDGELFPNEDCFSQNGSMESYREYMAKNLIRLERYFVNSYGNDWQGGYVILIPKKYMENEAQNYDESNRKKFISSKENFWQI